MLFIVLAVLLSAAALLAVAYPMLARARAATPAAGAAQETLDELLGQRDATLQALRELNFDHNLGKIGDEDFVAFEANLKQTRRRLSAGAWIAGRPRPTTNSTWRWSRWSGRASRRWPPAVGFVRPAATRPRRMRSSARRAAPRSSRPARRRDRPAPSAAGPTSRAIVSAAAAARRCRRPQRYLKRKLVAARRKGDPGLIRFGCIQNQLEGWCIALGGNCVQHLRQVAASE